jgi:hypothetical protein
MHPVEPEVIASQEYVVFAGGPQLFSQPAFASRSVAINATRILVCAFMFMRL